MDMEVGLGQMREWRLPEANEIADEANPKAHGCWAWKGVSAAGGIVVSAVLYLYDFASTINTLKTYYYYNYSCPHLLDTDSECHRLATHNNNYRSAFIICLVLMVTAHLTGSLVFFIKNLMSEGGSRFRYIIFLPVMHLYYLFEVFRKSLSCESIVEFYAKHSESIEWFGVLGASLDSVPQLILQFNIAIELGNYSASEEGAVPIPPALIASIIGAIASATYCGYATIYKLVSDVCPSCIGAIYIAIIAGLQTLAIVVTKTIMISTLAIAYYGGLWITPYSILSIIFSGIFCFVIFRKDMKNMTGKAYWWKIVETLAYAHVSTFIGPMYVIVKNFKQKSRAQLYSNLALGILMQIMVEMLGIVEMVLIGRYLYLSGIPCRREEWKSRNDNKYLTCHSVSWIFGTTFFVIMLTSLMFIVLYQHYNTSKQDGNS